MDIPDKPSAYDPRRMEAMYVFVTDLDKCSLPQLQKDPRFSDIPIGTLTRWHNVDKWADLRNEALAKIRSKLQKQLELSMSETLSSELDNLDAMISESKLQMGRVGAKSWEGVAKVMLNALARKDEIVQRISAEQVNSVGDGDVGSDTPAVLKSGTFDTEDFREAASYLLRKRIDRAKTEQVEAEETKPEGED